VQLPSIGITLGRGSKDRPVQRHARDAGRIIVTGNGSDFALEMESAAKRCRSATECFCGVGMITVPNGMDRVAYSAITRELRLGQERISWVDVFACNLEVRIRRDGSFEVLRQPVCEFFLRDHADCEDCQRLGIVPRVRL
jgi:hypothetical protein